MESRLSGRLGQVAFYVPDMAKAKYFYHEVLGLPLLQDAGEMLFLDMGGVRLMLSHRHLGEPSQAGAILYFETDNIKAMHAKLLLDGVLELRAPQIIHQTDISETWMSFFNDPFGNTLALMQEKPR